MSKVKTALRLLLGLMFVVFGLNFFLHFLAQPPPAEAAAGFLGGLFGAGYFFPFLKITEILVGLMLLANVMVPLALVVLAPITLNIFLMHLFLDPSGLPIAIVLTGLNIALGILYIDSYRGMLKVRA